MVSRRRRGESQGFILSWGGCSGAFQLCRRSGKVGTSSVVVVRYMKPMHYLLATEVPGDTYLTLPIMAVKR